MSRMIRILIIDDHPLVREGLHAIISLEADMEVVGEAGDGDQAVRLAHKLHPDVILMDLLMPGMSGGEAIPVIREDHPEQKILVLTSVDDVQMILATVRAGARGYVSKNAPPEELLAAIRALHRGSVVLPAPIAQALIAEEPPPPSTHPADVLTDRETEVLTYVARGWNNDDIAKDLVISPRTVSVHVSRILTKLELDNRTQAALYALRSGLVSL